MKFNIVQVLPLPEDSRPVHTLCFVEVAHLLRYGLEDLGHDVIFGEALQPDRYNIVLGYHLLFGAPLPEGYPCIVYQLEQLAETETWQAGFLDTLRSADVVWDFSPENIALLARHGISAVHKPLGFHPKMMRVAPAAEQDVDILFYGSLNDRRRCILAELQRRFHTKVLMGIYGEDRDRWISRAKIVLDLHFYPTRLFDEVRLSYLLNNRVFVIVEDTPHKKYQETLVYAPYEALVDTCAYYLKHPAQRRERAEAAFRHFTKWPESGFLRRAIAESL